jgi:hypothetical protein
MPIEPRRTTTQHGVILFRHRVLLQRLSDELLGRQIGP